MATHSSIAWRIPGTGAWWAAVYGVAKSWTRLKRLSSSISSKIKSREQKRIKHQLLGMLWWPTRLVNHSKTFYGKTWTNIWPTQNITISTWQKFGVAILVRIRLFPHFTVHNLIPPKQRQLLRPLLRGARPGKQSQGLSHWVALAYSFYICPSSTARLLWLDFPKIISKVSF